MSAVTVEKYRVRPRKPPSPTWRAFLGNHMGELLSLDFFTVSTVRFHVLFVLITVESGLAVSTIDTDALPECRPLRAPHRANGPSVARRS